MVYVMVGGIYVKVGVSKDPERRFREVSTAVPFEIELVDYWRVRDPYEMERDIHRRLDQWRVKGEWFMIDTSLPNGYMRDIIYQAAEDFDAEWAEDIFWSRFAKEEACTSTE